MSSVTTSGVAVTVASFDSGNYPLCRILTNLYEVCPEPLEAQASALVSLLPHAEPVEKSALFALLEQVAARRADALRPALPHLLSYLCAPATPQPDPGCMCIDILQVSTTTTTARPPIYCMALNIEHWHCVNAQVLGIYFN